MILKCVIILVQTAIVITGVISSYGDGHGVFNGGISWEYPICGRKASRCYGIVQLLMLLITCIEYTFFKPGIIRTLIGAVVELSVPFFVAMFVLYRLADKEAKKDELHRKKEIEKEETMFYK